MSLTETIFEIGSKLSIPCVLIGGLALPAYNVVRTTLDIDIAIYVKTQEELNNFIDALSQNGIKTLQNPKINHDLFTIFGKNNEAEIWLKPCDTFNWDQKMIKKTFIIEKNMKVLSIEDFILTKLARSDRSSTDINDVIQILIANTNSINWDYLYYRLNWAEVKEDFENLLNQLLLNGSSKFQDDVNKIIKEYQKCKENKNNNHI